MKKKIISIFVSMMVISALFVYNNTDFVLAEAFDYKSMNPTVDPTVNLLQTNNQYEIDVNDALSGTVTFSELKTLVDQKGSQVIKVGLKIDNNGSTFRIDLDNGKNMLTSLITIATMHQDVWTGDDGYWLISDVTENSMKLSAIYKVTYSNLADGSSTSKFYKAYTDLVETYITAPTSEKKVFNYWTAESGFNQDNKLIKDAELKAIWTFNITWQNKNKEVVVTHTDVASNLVPPAIFDGHYDAYKNEGNKTYNLFEANPQWSPDINGLVVTENTVIKAQYLEVPFFEGLTLEYKGTQDLLKAQTNSFNEDGIWKWTFEVTNPDNTKNTFDNTLPQGNGIGEYKIKCIFEYDHNGYSLNDEYEVITTITKGKPDASYYPSAKDLRYTGSSQILINPGKSIEDAKWTYSLDGNTYSEELPKQNYVGTYKVYYKLEGTNYSDEGSIDVSIKKLLMPVPTLYDKTYVYNGNEQKCLYKLEMANTLFEIHDTQTNAGHHELTFTILKENLSLYEWDLNDPNVLNGNIQVRDNGTTLVYPFVIEQQPVAIPELDSNVYTYNGNPHTYTLANSDLYTVTNNVQTNAGNHEVVVELNDDQNYKWDTDSALINEGLVKVVDNKLVYDFKIHKLAVDAPSADKGIYYYNGQNQNYQIEETDKYAVLNGSQKEAGHHVVTVQLKDFDNHYWSHENEETQNDSVYYDFYIYRQAVEKPLSKNGTFVYNGQHQIFTLKESELYTISNNSRKEAGSQTVTVSLNDKKNYCWEGFEANYDLEKAVLDLAFIFEIEAKPLKVDVKVQDKVYDATNNATISSNKLVGVCGNDEVLLNKVKANFKQSDVGSDIEVKLGNYELSGKDAANYTLTQPSGLKANITQRTLQVVGIKADNKTYDETNVATYSNEARLEGVCEEDLSKVKLVTKNAKATFDGVEVKDRRVVTFTGFAIEGEKAHNYKLLQAAKQNADIKPALVDKPEIGQNTFTYDGSDHTYTIAEHERYSISENVANDVGRYEAVISLTDDHNYAWEDGHQEALRYEFIVEPKVISANVSVKDKTYDETTKAELKDVVFEGIVEGDSVSFEYAAVAFESPEVSEEAKATISGLKLTGADAHNYSIGTITVSPAIIKAKPIVAMIVGGASAIAVAAGGIYFFLKNKKK